MSDPHGIYLSGPIAGDQYRDFESKRKTFQQYRDFFLDKGHSDGIDPFDIIPECDEYCRIDELGRRFPLRSDLSDFDVIPYRHTWGCSMRYDLLAMLARCDRIVMLPHWQMSPGARLENQIAMALGFKEIRVAYDVETLEPKEIIF